MTERPADEGTTTVADAPVVEALAEAIDAAVAEADVAGPVVDETKALLQSAGSRGLIDTKLRRLDPRDAAEALVGSVIFASPLLVEDGVFDIADHLFGSTVYGVPVFLLANTGFVVVMTYALVEWTGRDRDEAHRLFGAVPTRIVMILAVSFVVAAVLMTVWGRIDPLARPVEALARVTVLWTVGSLGAGLGDIVSEPDTTAPPTAGPTGTEDLSDAALLASLQEGLEELATVVDDAARKRELEQLSRRAEAAAGGERFGQQIRKYTTRDVAEAFVGSVFFSIPFLVEDGVFDVAGYFLSVRVGALPVLLVVNAGFVLAMIGALVYWAGPQDVKVSRPLFGVVPRRLVGIGLVSFLTAAMLMTMWGRVDGWTDPLVALARISAVWTVAAFGASLGDVLPGESSGDDLYDDLGELVGGDG